MDRLAIALRYQQVLYDKKWRKFLKRARIFRYIPFVEAALGAGSMAIGNVRPTSDFDVIVGTRAGRLFTARFLLILALDTLGWRRKNLDHGTAASDTICPNHFITRKSFTLSPPYNDYWQELYKRLVPLFGEPQLINDFFSMNQVWAGEELGFRDDLRHQKTPSFLKVILERLLQGRLGDWFEKQVKKFQIRRIETKLKPLPAYEPRIIYTDEELELHLKGTKKLENSLADFI